MTQGATAVYADVGQAAHLAVGIAEQRVAMAQGIDSAAAVAAECFRKLRLVFIG